MEYENKINNELKKLGNNHKEGRKLFVKNKLDNRPFTYLENKKWEKQDDIEDYMLFKYVCEFKGKDIRKLQLSELKCVYDENVGKCVSKRHLYYIREIEKSEKL